MRSRIYTLITAIVMLSVCSFAQTESLHEQLKKTFKQKYFNVGFLFQAVTEFTPEPAAGQVNGFNLANIRLTISGELDEGFGYRMQTNFISNPAILDALMYYKPTKSLRIDIGQFKTPFSTEYLISESAIDFVNRSQGADIVPPKRQIGIQVRGDVASNTLSLIGGVFNGSGTNKPNDNNDFMVVGRVIVSPELGKEAKLTLAGNAAISNDKGTPDNRKRTLFGGDIRFTYNNFMLSSEFNHQKLEPSSGADVKNYGYHVTAGYMISKKVQVLGRFDNFKPDGIDANKLVIIGCNFWPTEAVQFQFNYLVNPDDSDLKKNTVLINSQFAF